MKGIVFTEFLELVEKKFITKWIFDIEIFKRITLHFGLKKTKQLLFEQPLKGWIHADNSNLSIKDSIKVVWQLGQITWAYRRENKILSKLRYLYKSKSVSVS